jgi:VWFA-related protein
MSPKGLSIALIALASSVALAGQQPPVFRAESNFVELDAIVTDHQGRFVPGLTASDFIVREGSTTAPVQTFDVVDLPTPSRPSASPSARVRFSPTIAVPEGELNGRLYLLYFDVPSGGMGLLKARDLAKTFVTRYMQPGDTAAVWDAQAVAATIRFTDDKTALLSAVSRLDGGITTSGDQVMIDQTGHLRDAAELLRGIQGRRKSLMLFSTGFPTLVLSSRSVGLHSANWLPATSDLRAVFQPFASPSPFDITGLADVHIYTIDVRGLMAPPLGLAHASQPGSSGEAESARVLEQMTSADNLRSIADETGAVSIVATNDFSTGFERIVEDNSQYYVLGYRSSRMSSRDGFVSVKVEMVRPGLTVRARTGYLVR